MSLTKWFEARGPRFIWQRAISLLDRYGVATAKAVNRIDACVEKLAELGCAPTFPTPGIVVRRYPQFIRHLQEAGAEIAVHSYQHVDLRTLPVPVARQQLMRAVQTFERFGIQVRGFRCPYLGYSTGLLDSLPVGMFDYSSNEAIYWEPANLTANGSQFFEILCQFYQGRPASDTVCLPSTRSNVIEIPVCVPDDLQLHDGLQFDSEQVAQFWRQVLKQTHQRGELFCLLFHPELAAFCQPVLAAVLREARTLRPCVWLARLRDISDWWQEKSAFRVEVTQTSVGLHLSFSCSARATILAKELGSCGAEQAWDGTYYRVQTKTLDVPKDSPRPFVGLPANAPRRVASFLREQGYILDTSETATHCGTYLDTDTLAQLSSEVQLINHIEASAGPLVRYWRWPDGAKSALSITGDLDALTLLDYASRLFVG